MEKDKLSDQLFAQVATIVRVENRVSYFPIYDVMFMNGDDAH